MSKKDYVIGIDLGTTNSCVAIIENGTPVVIANSEGKRTTPSVVGFTDNDTKIGDAARRQSVVNAKRTISSIKRFMGRSYSESQNEIKRVSYEVVPNKDNIPCVKINERLYTPQEISAMILQKMKKTAEDYLGQEVTKAVVTVPAYFSDSERTATMEAGKIAGLDILRIINEPTAAALAYGKDKDLEKVILVVDVGGGTSDFSVLEIGSSVFEVKSTDGDTHLGGDDFDDRIIKWIVDEFKSEYSIDISKDVMAFQRIKESAEKAKIELSTSSQTDINLPYITVKDGMPIHFVKTLTKAKFESLIHDMIDKIMNFCKSAVDKANLKIDSISEVVLVGGSTRIPIMQDEIEKLFGKKPNKSVNPDEAVAIGAAIQGSIITGDIKDILLLDVTPMNLGICTQGEVMTIMVEANSTIPCSKTEIYTTASDNQNSVEIVIGQGMRPMFKDNKKIGTFHLDGIMPAPRGVPQISVTFDINSNGVLTVSAIDKATNKSNSVRIEGGSNLSKEDIERMKMEAQENAESDKKEREKIDKLNVADSLIFQTEKQMKEFGDKLTQEHKDKLNPALNKLKESFKEKDLTKIEESSKILNEIWGEISGEMYKNSQAPPADNQEPKVEDVEVEEVK